MKQLINTLNVDENKWDGPWSGYCCAGDERRRRWVSIANDTVCQGVYVGSNKICPTEPGPIQDASQITSPFQAQLQRSTKMIWELMGSISFVWYQNKI